MSARHACSIDTGLVCVWWIAGAHYHAGWSQGLLSILRRVYRGLSMHQLCGYSLRVLLFVVEGKE